MPTSGVVEHLLDEVHERAGARQLVRDHLDRELHAERLGQPLQLLDAPPRARRGCCRPATAAACAADRGATTSTLNGIRRAICSARSASASACARAVGVGAGQRQRRAPAPAGEALGDRRVHAVQLEAGFGEPLLQVGDRRRVVVVEVRPRREQLDALEPVRRDLEQVLAAQPLAVVEVRRDPERARFPSH